MMIYVKFMEISMLPQYESSGKSIVVGYAFQLSYLVTTPSAITTTLLLNFAHFLTFLMKDNNKEDYYFYCYYLSWDHSNAVVVFHDV